MRRRLLRPGLTKSLGAAAAVLALAAGGSALHGAVRIEPCASTEYTASIGGAPPEAPGPDRLTLVLVGDTGFNPKGAEVAPEGFVKDGTALGFKESLSGVAREVDGDLAFVNLETVVTDRNDLTPDSKGQTLPYNFKSHPAGLKALRWRGIFNRPVPTSRSMAQARRSASRSSALAGARA